MQLTPAQIEDEMRFWLGQDAEHNLFFKLGFDDPALKSEASRLHESYDTALRRNDLRAAMDILPASQAFKVHAMNVANQKWVGWIWPAFLDHTKRELDAMLMRTRPGGVSAREELCFGDRINAEHAAFASQLLDPTEVQTQNAARKASRQSHQLANECMTMAYPTLKQLSAVKGHELNQFVSNVLPGKKSIIHPVLAAHVLREGQRFLGKIADLPHPTENVRAF